MSRIGERFNALKADGRKALVCFITAGDGGTETTLAAMHALAAVPHGSPIMLIGTSDMLLRLRGDVTFPATAGERVSIWPLGTQRFQRSRGLRWPLDGLEMVPGGLVGTSNVATGGNVEITADAGDGYAVILPRDAMPRLLDAVMPSPA